MLKRFSLYQWINSQLRLKLITAIFCLAVIFIPATSFISYQYTYIDEQQTAHDRVHRMLDMVRYNASTAAYLSDSSLASQVVASLTVNPEIESVLFNISKEFYLSQGNIPESESDLLEVLSPSFSTDTVGTLELFFDYSYINNQAKEKALSLVVWQSFLLLLILGGIYIIFRQIVSQPLNQLLEQINSTSVDAAQLDGQIQVRSSDEIGFLAENTNDLMNRISSFYRSEAEKNAQIVKLESQFRNIFEFSHAGIALLNRNNQVFLSNPSFKSTIQHFNCDEELVYLPKFFDDSDEFEDQITRVRECGNSLFKDFRLKGRDDVWLRVLFSHVESDSDSSLDKFVELVIYDISDRAHKEKAFIYNATHDALTGVYNRRGAESKLREFCSVVKAQKSHFVIVWLDLNDFKIVNDEHGHEAGDIVLKESASRIRSILSPDDIIARWGGDEFIVALNLDDLNVLPSLLTRMENACTASIEINDELSVVVGASIGASTSSQIGYDVDELLVKADQLMYLVKKNGKTGFRIDR